MYIATSKMLKMEKRGYIFLLVPDERCFDIVVPANNEYQLLQRVFYGEGNKHAFRFEPPLIIVEITRIMTYRISSASLLHVINAYPPGHSVEIDNLVRALLAVGLCKLRKTWEDAAKVALPPLDVLARQCPRGASNLTPSKKPVFKLTEDFKNRYPEGFFVVELFKRGTPPFVWFARDFEAYKQQCDQDIGRLDYKCGIQKTVLLPLIEFKAHDTKLNTKLTHSVECYVGSEFPGHLEIVTVSKILGALENVKS